MLEFRLLQVFVKGQETINSQCYENVIMLQLQHKKPIIFYNE